MNSKARWTKLRQALLTKSKAEVCSQFETISFSSGVKVRIKREEVQMTRSELLEACQRKVDSTGRVRMWPAEESLANFMLINSSLFEGKRVCELGAGKTGLAAIALAVSLKDKIGEILISDGDDECCKAIQETIDENKGEMGLGGQRIR